MSIIKSIKSAFRRANEKNWPTVYFAIDIHDTIVKGNYNADEIPTEFFPDAEKTLQTLTKRQDIKLILYTCSHPNEIEQYQEFFKSKGIIFDYVNCNPEVTTEIGGYGNYDNKFYFNVLLDDKAGFDALNDWPIIESLVTLEQQPYLISDEKNTLTYKYNPDFGDDKLCRCGHTYYRHFDTYEKMDAIGCKYCRCFSFKEK
jgi:hypothetical protein